MFSQIWWHKHHSQTYPSIAKFFDGLPSMTNIAPSEDAVNSKSPFSENLSTHENNETDVPAPFSLTIRYEMLF